MDRDQCGAMSMTGIAGCCARAASGPRSCRAAEELNELSPLHFADPKPKDYAREFPPLSARLN